ncbi:DUF2970 domain-containing protein [Vibrio sp. Of7-15]|uniref:DUF2970 domain-containing protein n=1 Tax=Vibrio sp. Of7-15 TaxID=2724879 RepID=UPI001EF387F6|nr:DUF2970 domain-containing protein [Vibrio sp. Of7-15]
MPFFIQVLKSVAGAFFGVQSEQQRQQDFQQDQIWPYILMGIFGVLLFIALLVTIVQWVL